MPVLDQDHQAQQTTGYWIEYFAERIRAVIHDEALPWAEQQRWLDEVTEDMTVLAANRLAVTDENVQRAHRMARAMQSFVFHHGPDPDADTNFVANNHPVTRDGEPIPSTAFVAPTTESPAMVTSSATAHDQTQVILIPYIAQDDDVAEVWIGRLERTAYAHVDIPLLALADFAGEDMRNPEGIQDHCDAWGADRILVPSEETPLPAWTAYTITSVLAGNRVEAL